MESFSQMESVSIDKKSKENIIDLVLHTIKDEKQVVIFNNSKSSSELTAEKISKYTNLKSNELEELSNKVLKSIPNPTKQCIRLANCVKSGTAFHHSGLVAKQRNLIEEAFRSGLIKVISSTPTLAAGLNLPAYKVIVKDYKRYSPRGFNDIPVLEYHQMSGRAGRPGIEKIGKAVLLVKSQDELDRTVGKYIFGKPEEIISKLAVEPTLKMYILSLVSMNMINSQKEIEEFFKNTLYAHQYQDLEGLYYNIFRILDILKEYDFISQDDDYYVATPIGKKISELYLNPDTAHYFLENIDKFFKEFSKENIRKDDIFKLVNFVTDTIEMRPLFRVGKPEQEIYMQKIEEISKDLIIPFNPFESDYQEFMNAIKTTEVLIDWIYEAPEDYISDKYKVTPGELNYKMDVVDWLLYCLEEISLMKKNYFFRNLLNKLRIRFKAGVKEELLPLITLTGIGRVRARKLYNNGFKKLADIKKAQLSQLARVIGEKMAINIKTQVSDGQEVSDTELKFEKEKPKEMKIREVSDEEVEELVIAHKNYEKEKEATQTDLLGYF